MRSLVKDQWLGNHFTHTGALQMDCGSFLTSGHCQPAKCTSPLEGDEGFKYLLMASDWLLITLSSMQVLCSNQGDNRSHAWTNLMLQCLYETLTQPWCRQAPLGILNYLMLIKSQPTFWDGLLAWVPKLVLLCTLKGQDINGNLLGVRQCFAALATTFSSAEGGVWFSIHSFSLLTKQS